MSQQEGEGLPTSTDGRELESPWDIYANGDYRDGHEERRALRRGGILGVLIVCAVCLRIEVLGPNESPHRRGLHPTLQNGALHFYTAHGFFHYLWFGTSLAILTLADWRALFHALAEWRRLPFNRDALVAWTLRFARPLFCASLAAPSLWFIWHVLKPD